MYAPATSDRRLRPYSYHPSSSLVYGQVVKGSREVASWNAFTVLRQGRYCVRDTRSQEGSDYGASRTGKDLARSLAQRQDARVGNKQIEDDFSEGGAGMALLAKWDGEIRTGRSVPESIRQYDKLMVILTEHSTGAPGWRKRWRRRSKRSTSRGSRCSFPFAWTTR
jgi:hypothetical protein